MSVRRPLTSIALGLLRGAGALGVAVTAPATSGCYALTASASSLVPALPREVLVR